MDCLSAQEAYCSALCQHPLCWEGQRREARGISKQDFFINSRNTKKTATEEGLPTQKIVNLSDTFDHVLDNDGYERSKAHSSSANAKPSINVNYRFSNSGYSRKNLKPPYSVGFLYAPSNTQLSIRDSATLFSKKFDAVAKENLQQLPGSVHIAEVQELFEPSDLKSSWKKTFMPKRTYVWVPGNGICSTSEFHRNAKNSGNIGGKNVAVKILSMSSLEPPVSPNKFQIEHPVIKSPQNAKTFVKAKTEQSSKLTSWLEFSSLDVQSELFEKIESSEKTENISSEPADVPRPPLVTLYVPKIDSSDRPAVNNQVTVLDKSKDFLPAIDKCKKDEKPTVTKSKLSSVCLFTGDKSSNTVRPFNYKSSSMDIAFAPRYSPTSPGRSNKTGQDGFQAANYTQVQNKRPLSCYSTHVPAAPTTTPNDTSKRPQLIARRNDSSAGNKDKKTNISNDNQDTSRLSLKLVSFELPPVQDPSRSRALAKSCKSWKGDQAQQEVQPSPPPPSPDIKIEMHDSEEEGDDSASELTLTATPPSNMEDESLIATPIQSRLARLRENVPSGRLTEIREIEKRKQQSERYEVAESRSSVSEQRLDMQRSTDGRVQGETKVSFSEETKAGFLEETKAGFLEETKAGFSEETKVSFSEETKAGFLEETKAGFLEETKAGFLEETKAVFLEGIEADSSEATLVEHGRTGGHEQNEEMLNVGEDLFENSDNDPSILHSEKNNIDEEALGELARQIVTNVFNGARQILVKLYTNDQTSEDFELNENDKTSVDPHSEPLDSMDINPNEIQDQLLAEYDKL